MLYLINPIFAAVQCQWKLGTQYHQSAIASFDVYILALFYQLIRTIWLDYYIEGNQIELEFIILSSWLFLGTRQVFASWVIS